MPDAAAQTMTFQGRRLDHWTTSLDAVEALRLRIAEVDGPQEDAVTRQLMAQVAHAKSSSFIALLDVRGTCSTSTRPR